MLLWHYISSSDDWWIIWVQIKLTRWVVRYRRPFLWPLNSGWLFPSNPNSTSSQYNKILQKKQGNISNLQKWNVLKTPCLKDNNKLKKATNQFVYSVYSATYSVWFKNLSRTKRRLMINICRQIIFIIV